MNVDINITGQEEGKFQKFYLIAGAIIFIFIGVTFLFPGLGINRNIFILIVYAPWFIHGLLYVLGRKSAFADIFPHLRINEERIENCRGGLFTKSEIYCWSDIKAIDIKLFEIQMTTKKNELKSVDLTNLTDDNLKFVKEFVAAIKKRRGL